MERVFAVRGDSKPIRAAVSWSSGKDCATALNAIRANPGIEVVALLSVVNQVHDRIAMHAVRRAVLAAQADAIGLPVITVEIPSPCSNEQYEAAMSGALDELARDGVEQLVFGDLFLEDIRAYREKQMSATRMRAVFPLWKRDTRELAEEIITSGTKAVVTCVDPKQLDGSFVGRPFNADFLRDLPPSVDPCGENGEFHTFVYGGPVFERELDIEVGEVVERDGFVFADVTLRQ